MPGPAQGTGCQPRSRRFGTPTEAGQWRRSGMRATSRAPLWIDSQVPPPAADPGGVDLLGIERDDSVVTTCGEHASGDRHIIEGAAVDRDLEPAARTRGGIRIEGKKGPEEELVRAARQRDLG